jgi:hypothetical protein
MAGIFKSLFRNNGIGIVSDTVSTYASLPSPASLYVGQFWLVTDNSGGLLSALGVYKYPRGIYSPNASNVWELVPINVRVAEDAVTLSNITNWAEYIGYSQDIKAGDQLRYNGTDYINQTGTQTATAPDTDTTNWLEKPSGGGGGFIKEFPAGSWDFPDSNPFLLDPIDCTSHKRQSCQFSDSLLMSGESQFDAPATISESTLNIQFFGRAISPVSDRYIRLQASYIATADDEDPNVAYTDIDSADILTNSTAGDLQRISFNVSMPTWAGKNVKLRFKRIALSGGGTPLVGNWATTGVIIYGS